MTSRRKALASVAAAGAAVMVFGFVLFATAATREAPMPRTRAEGIVVLTGGELRVAEGARLLAEGAGRRLLISGVNHKTSRQDVWKLTGLDQRAFDCCVDLGYEAQDTVGNASETKSWVEKHGFGSLVVVTASYHMPRGLAELAIELPGVHLVPHPVLPRSLRHDVWWLHPATTRVLISEYVKFLPAAARLAVARLVRPAGNDAVAGKPKSLSGRM